jgi:hypothetical protein
MTRPTDLSVIGKKIINDRVKQRTKYHKKRSGCNVNKKKCM